jgi:phosphomethylpyrimidine synthase
MCGPHFCSMKLTQDVRDYAEAHGVNADASLAEGLRAKAAEFRAGGQELYLSERDAAGKRLAAEPAAVAHTVTDTGAAG